MASINQAACGAVDSSIQDLVGVNSSKTILITGGSGFAASHILHAFLRRGYRVRTTVRSKAKAESVKTAHPRFSDKLEITIVPELSVPGAHDEAVKGVAGVIHTASPFHFNITDFKKDLLDPAIGGTTSLLVSIQKHAPQVKRVVITSSVDAIIDSSKGAWPEHTYSEADWNPITQQEGEAGPASAAYSASKALAERAAYDYVEREKPNFTVAAINPPFIFGPIAHDADISGLNTSLQELWQYINGSLVGQPIAETEFPVYVDVRDIAEAHLKAFERGEQGGNERFIVSAGQFQNPDIARVIRKNFPELKDKVPDPEGANYVDVFKIDNSKSIKELGLSYIPFEKVITDSIKSLLKLEKAQKEGRKLEWRFEEWA